MWVTTLLLFAALSVAQMVGFSNLFKPGIEFQIQETYIVLNNFHFLYPVFPTLLFAVFLVRVVTLNFENTIANIVLIASTLVMLVFTTSLIDLINELTQGWFVLSSDENLPLERVIPESHLLRAKGLLQSLRVAEVAIIVMAGWFTFKRRKA